MRIVIALASHSAHFSGVQRHAINLAHCLIARPEITEVHMATAPWQESLVRDSVPTGDPRLHVHIAPIGDNVFSRNRWFYSQLPRLAAHLHTDIVHLAYPVPMRRGAFHCKTVVTLHDLYPYDIPDNFGFPKVLFNRALLQQCLRRVDAIACVSQCTLSRLKSLSPKLSQKATVINNCVEPHSEPDTETSPLEWGSHPFLLCVAQHRRNKNILLVLQVFERLLRSRLVPSAAQLLIVGIEGPETPAIKNLIAKSELAQRVVLLSGISDSRLQWCYRNCSLVLAPSIVEGFGLPVAEALLAGCRVVCTDIAAFRELGGTSCHYVPIGPMQVEAFTDAVCAALRKPVPEPLLLPQFSQPVIAEAFMQLYRSLLPVPGEIPSANPANLPSAEERQYLL
jgi:glycosyltransferase involved in cell wall biosynthesis